VRGCCVAGASRAGRWAATVSGAGASMLFLIPQFERHRSRARGPRVESGLAAKDRRRTVRRGWRRESAGQVQAMAKGRPLYCGGAAASGCGGRLRRASGWHRVPSASCCVGRATCARPHERSDALTVWASAVGRGCRGYASGASHALCEGERDAPRGGRVTRSIALSFRASVRARVPRGTAQSILISSMPSWRAMSKTFSSR
jgi:hypothetical protein